MGGSAVSRVIIQRRTAAPVLFIALPPDPSSADATAHWWRLAADSLEAGTGDEWLAAATEARVIGLAPAALARLAFSAPAQGAASPQQAATIARMSALESSLGDPETLHCASAVLDDGPPTVVTAVVANSVMQGWIDWADGLGARIDHIVPAAMLLPLGDEWVAAQVGSERIIGRRGMVLPDEPALKDALLGEGEAPLELDADLFALALRRLDANPVPDLRTGRFARRRRIVIDRRTARELVVLTLAIILVTILVALVEIVRLDRSRARLDSETLEIARAAAGPGVTLETAESAVAASAGPAASGSMSAPVAALLARLQPEQNLSVSTLGYSGGSLSVSLAGPGPDAINRVLLALQRDGYRVTAVPRTQANGQTVADVTLREGP